MAELTKDEIRAELDRLGATQPPSNATRDDLLEALRGAETEIVEDWDVLPGDEVRYCLTADNAAYLTAREQRTARMFKAVAPFEVREYSEGDVLAARVVSAYEDGTVTVDLASTFPRVTFARIPEGDEPGTYRKRG